VGQFESAAMHRNALVTVAGNPRMAQPALRVVAAAHRHAAA
jgi:hypothetical protein